MPIMIAALALLQAGAAPATCVPAPAKTIASPASLPWYTGAETIKVSGRSYHKYGLPRVLAAGEVEFFAAYHGGYFFAERGNPSREVLYMLTNLAGCEFQPYDVVASK